jgi:hypothetical protein
MADEPSRQRRMSLRDALCLSIDTIVREGRGSNAAIMLSAKEMIECKRHWRGSPDCISRRCRQPS